MKKFDKKTWKVVGASGMAIFSLSSAFAGTYAWFAMNASVSATGMSVKIARMTGRLSNVYFHAFDSTNSTETTFKFNKTPFAT